MSRIGKLPIKIPNGVNINYNIPNLTVKGKFGELEQKIPNSILIEQTDGNLIVSPKVKTRTSQELHGLYRSLIFNMITGVSEGWTKRLELVGVGYRASNRGQVLDLALGFSHNISMQIPSEVKLNTVSEKGKNPVIELTSFDKQLVGMIASKIRSFRKPEPYKGKGVRYVGEIVRKKAGKSAAK